jgi:hypothetical protein
MSMGRSYFCRERFSSGSGDTVQPERGEKGEKGSLKMCMADGWCDSCDCCLARFNVSLVIDEFC